MTKIDVDYILRLYGVYDRITTKISHLDGEILSGASPDLLEKLDELNALSNELQDIFEEVLTVEYKQQDGVFQQRIRIKDDA